MNQPHLRRWSAAELAALKHAYVEQSLTGGQIVMRRLLSGKSRSAILGKVRRMQLKHRSAA